ncbi:MAG TPA: hypothetical protein VF735_16275 [Pyrinomonadaceae bacterium]|jgi:hypothetical protein
MTNEQHNKTLGILHLVYGALHGLMMLMFVIFFAVIVPVVREGNRTHDGMPFSIYLLIITLISLFGLFYSVPSLVAGYALLKRKSWARMAGIIGSVIAAMSVPLGTALCVYTLWFLFGQGAHMHDAPSLSSHEPYSLRDASASSADLFDRATGERSEREPAQTRRMPNWRD